MGGLQSGGGSRLLLPAVLWLLGAAAKLSPCQASWCPGGCFPGTLQLQRALCLRGRLAAPAITAPCGSRQLLAHAALLLRALYMLHAAGQVVL